MQYCLHSMFYVVCMEEGGGFWRWKVMADLTTIYSCPSKLICEVATLPHETRMIWVELVFLLSKEASWKQWISSSLSCHKITRESNTHSYENKHKHSNIQCWIKCLMFAYDWYHWCNLLLQQKCTAVPGRQIFKSWIWRGSNRKSTPQKTIVQINTFT